MDEAAHGEGRHETQRPKDEEDNGDGVKHGNAPSCKWYGEEATGKPFPCMCAGAQIAAPGRRKLLASTGQYVSAFAAGQQDATKQSGTGAIPLSRQP